MEIKQIAKIKGERQDGAFFGGYLFSFNHRGICAVYRVEDLKGAREDETTMFSEFALDKINLIAPHSNAVMFGNEYYQEGDEFPLLYTNVYNNYAKDADKKIGVCLAYRLKREGNTFTSTLVQMIEIGFTQNEQYWKSKGLTEDIRPYGNFTIDREKGIYYAFTMIDSLMKTRYFAFVLPKAKEGIFSEEYGVPKVVLETDDIIDYFDCEYHRFIQGACFNEGKIYSLEGFTSSEENPPAVRVIDTKAKKMICCKFFADSGMNIEPEMIDFYENNCYYGDHYGNLYQIFEHESNNSVGLN